MAWGTPSWGRKLAAPGYRRGREDAKTWETISVILLIKDRGLIPDHVVGASGGVILSLPTAKPSGQEKGLAGACGLAFSPGVGPNNPAAKGDDPPKGDSEMHDCSFPDSRPEPLVCVVDRESAQLIRDLFRSLAPNLPIRTFRDYAEVRKALDCERILPTVVVGDTPLSQPRRHGLADTYAPQFGLSSFVHYGGGEPSPEAKDLQAAGLIREVFNRFQAEQMANYVIAAHQKLVEDPTLQSLGEEIAAATYADEEYYRAPDGRLLSLRDIYREVFCNTPLGQHLRALWERVSSEDEDERRGSVAAGRAFR